MFEGVNIRLEPMRKSNLEKCLRSIPTKVYFKGFCILTSIEEIKTFFNKYGKLQSLTQFELSHGVDGKLEYQGYVVYSSPFPTDKLLSKGPYHKYQGRIVLIDGYTRKEAKRSMLSERNYKKKVHYFANDDSESEENYNCGHLRLPKLDFRSRENTRQIDGHAFSGYFIRPYMRSVNLVKSNIDDSHNIRVNIVSPMTHTQASPVSSIGNHFTPENNLVFKKSGANFSNFI